MQAFISGIVPLSTSKWYGKISSVVLFGGCDFRCRYCFVPGLLEFKQEFLTDTKPIINEVNKYKELIEVVIFSGGEPCLQRISLILMAKYFKCQGIKIGIDTNGSKPNVIRELLSLNLLDFISLDMKTPLNPEIFSKVTRSKTFFTVTSDIINNIKESVSIIKKHQNEIDVEVKTVVIPSLLYKKEDILGIAKTIKGLKCTWVLQQFDNKEELVDKNLKNIQPPSRGFLENLKGFCLKEYPELRIKIRED